MQSRETGGNISSSRNEMKKGNSGRKALQQLALLWLLAEESLFINFFPRHIPILVMKEHF